MSELIFDLPDDGPDALAVDPGVVRPWKILVVDDDVSVHETTLYSLETLIFRGRPMQFLSAFSGREAREVLQQHSDIALALIDVVMETSHSGLELVRYIREDLGNRMISLVLRTGQPGYAPERGVILDYEINDYKSKADLSVTMLITAVVSALRTHANNIVMDQMAKQLEAQLLQSEKMASLGLLVANVAHEINTPIGAIKSSGASIVDGLGQALQSLPKVLQTLDENGQALFLRLILPATSPVANLSTREERAIRRDVTQQLEEAGIADAAHQASLLVQLHAQSAVANYLQLLRHPQGAFILDTAASVASIVRSAHNINAAVERVSKIVFALKAFSRVSSGGEMVEADLAEGIDTVLTIYHNQIKQGIELVRQFDVLPRVPCLPDELTQVWTNLIHNALQAMNHQGTLTVTLRRVGDEAVVSVGDTGCGIPEAIRERIFDPFFTTKPAGEGSGLGLDIVKKIVDKHRGRIEVQSTVGLGTTLLVYLPYPVPQS